MHLTVEQVYKEALQLPDESKASLAERLVDSAPGTERLHIDTAKRRRDEVRSGLVQPIDGEEAWARVRNMIKE